MKKLMFVAVAALSTAAFAAHEDISANAEGYYDVTLTTKHLRHSEKTVSKTFTTSNTKGTAVEQFWEHMGTVTNYAGFTIISGGVTADTEAGVKKVQVKYSYYDFKTNKDGTKTMVTKVISKSSKGVYDAATGKVYLYDAADKYEVTYDAANADIIVASKQNSKGVEQVQKGYKAYEVPLAMHKQFIATDDNKAAGGFTGGVATATDGQVLDFAGLTAFGTGTINKEILKTVSGNVAGKYPNDLKFGCYGTWKLSLDSKSSKYESIKDALLAKKCVELVNEKDETK